MNSRRRCSFVRGPALALLLLVCACDAKNELPQGADERITNKPDLTIGLIEGDSAYLFGDIRSVAVDTAGRIYVGDRIGANIRVYDFVRLRG